MPMSRRRMVGLIAATAVVVAFAPLRMDYQLVLVIGNSMTPTFHTGDVVVVDKRAYSAGRPKRGDVVLVRHSGELWVKRVVGMPSERIEVKGGKVWINGAPLSETNGVVPGPVDIAAGQLFPGRFAVLGDCRSAWPRQSIHAVVGEHEILGKVRWRILPGPASIAPFFRAR
jgi:signal peptidase I